MMPRAPQEKLRRIEIRFLPESAPILKVDQNYASRSAPEWLRQLSTLQHR